MEPIRVLNLFTIMNHGGSETMVMNYYRSLDRTKIQFDFLVHRSERGAYDDEIESLGGRIYRTIPIYPQNFKRYKEFLKKFFEEHPEYQIIHSHMSELGYFAFKEAKKKNVPFRICHAHSCPREFDLKMIVRNYFKKNMMKYITHMFTCGYDSACWLYGEKNREKFIMMNNAIEAEKYVYNSTTAIKERQRYGLDDKFVIGHVGSFKYAKNHDFIIDIFREIYSRDQNARLVLIGEGELKSKIEEKIKRYQIQDAVVFLGTRKDIGYIMNIFDVFLFPSLFEGLGIALIEAQANGLKCFTSDVVVPIEAKVTNLIEYIPLEAGIDFWARRVMEYKAGYERKNMYHKIVNAGYDASTQVAWLENFYLLEIYNK